MAAPDKLIYRMIEQGKKQAQSSRNAPKIGKLGKRYPDYVWAIVLPYLRAPLPSVLSSPPRSVIRQHSLTQAIRVCKLFAAICEPILYGPTLITDDLPTLLVDITKPATHRRLGYIRHLRIEYSPKGEERGYPMLLRRGGDEWELSGYDDKERRFLEYGLETEAISKALYHLNETGPRRIFKRLETIAVASIYGGDHGSWNDFHNDLIRRKVASILQTCVDNFDCLLSHLPLRHFCTRSSDSPCGMRPISAAESDDPGVPDPQICDRTFHYSESTAELPLYIGGNLRWVCDAGKRKNWRRKCFKTARARLSDTTGLLQKVHAQEDNEFKRQVQIPLEMEVYGPTRERWDGDDEAANAEESEHLGKEWEKVFRSATGQQDLFRWYPASSIQPCPGCRYVFPPSGA